MANIIWTPPEGWVEETGAHVSFIAPCNCETAGKLVIGENEYDIVNAVGETVTGVGGAFASGAMLDFILDCTNLNAYIQNQAFSIDRVYPVGSIYMSVNNTDPGDLFGGTWSQIQDTFLLAAGSNHAAGSTGGEEETTVDLSHSHDVDLDADGYTDYSSCSHKHSITAGSTVAYSASGTKYAFGSSSASTGDSNNTSHRHGVSVSVSGTTGEALESVDIPTMPPYLTVYMWQRTA